MKALNRIVSTLTVALSLAAPAGVMAQSQLSGPNGTAMSPKQRFLRGEQQATLLLLPVANPSAQAVYPNTAEVAGSPKQVQLQTQNQTSGVAQPSGNVAFYRPTGADGITASPKLRQQLDEQSMQFQIAPLK